MEQNLIKITDREQQVVEIFQFLSISKKKDILALFTSKLVDLY
jgi:hypothetical protein